MNPGFAKFQRAKAEHQSRLWKPLVEYFKAHGNEIVLQHEVDEWRKTHPDFPFKSAVFMRGERTKMRKIGLL